MLYSTGIQDTLNATQPQRSGPASNQLDKDAFLTLLTAQLQNQDPIDPTSQEEFIQQVASFTNLEQQIEINENFSRLLNFQAIAQAASLIGKGINGVVDGKLVAGVVEQVIFVGGEAILALDSGLEVPQSGLVSIYDPAHAPEGSDDPGTDPGQGDDALGED